MKNFTFKLGAPVLVALASLFVQPVMADVTYSRPQKMMQKVHEVRPFRGQKPWHNAGDELTARMRQKAGVYAAAPGSKEPEPVLQFSELNNYNYLEGPDGTTWFYISEYETEWVETGGVDWQGNPFGQNQIVGFTFTIYDNLFNKVGVIKDDIKLEENETGVATISLDPALTKKFFNYDDNIEVMVYTGMNTGPEMNYKVNYHNKVYAIGGQKDERGNDVCIAQIDGRCADAVNLATNSWDENFYLTFVEDVTPPADGQYDTFLDYVNAHKTNIKIYRKAGWNGGPEVVMEKDIHLVNYPGDTTDGIYFISKAVGNTIYFIFSQYEKPYFLDPTGFATDESATPDNNFMIEVYSYNGSTLKEVSTTKIPVEIEPSTTGVNYTFYSIGSLAWQRDVDMSVNGTPQAPAFIVAIDHTTAADLETVITDFYIYDNSGKEVTALAENIDGVVMLADLPGTEPQALFLNLVNNSYILSFVDIYSGNLALSMPQSLGTDNLTANCNRVASTDGTYKYAFELLGDTTDDEGNQYAGVAWLNMDGTVDRIDRIKVGKRVARAQINMAPDVLQPYLYDTDSEMEYAVLVGRYTGTSNTQVENQFMVVDHDGTPMITFGPDAKKGAPYLFTVLFDKKQNHLQMIYQISFREYSIDIYTLPFNMMAGGDGSAADPYQIATVGDLQMIKANPAANYIVVNNIDASNYEFVPVEEFSGVLDGDGYHISNLTVGATDGYSGLFGTVEIGAVLRNLTFIDPTVKLGGSTNTGLLGGWVRQAQIDNVKVYGLTASDETFDGVFGGLAGLGSVSTSITNSGVFASDINLPKANVGGILGRAQTGVKVNACAFTGKMVADSEAGGILGASTVADVTVSNCHVDADLTAKNTLGGIIGSSNRSIVSNCYVEGTLTATEAPKWGTGFNVGGVVGQLAVDWEGVQDNVIVSGNVIALKSITTPKTEFTEDFPGQMNSVHRIVGASSLNDAEFDYDSSWNPVYGEPYAEYGLANNYALSSLATVDSKTEATATSTEGADIDAIERVFLDETLGWAFGEDGESPWHKYSDKDPWLYFEAAFVITPGAVRAEENSKFNLTVRFLSNEEVTLDEVVNDLLCEYDNTIIEMTGNAWMENNVMTIEFDALKQGKTTFTMSVGGQSSSATVEVVEEGSLGDTGSVSDITADNTLSIVFDGRQVTAEGANVEVYSTSGVKVAAGQGAASVESLAKGIYVAVATDSKGNRATIKVAVR